LDHGAVISGDPDEMIRRKRRKCRYRRAAGSGEAGMISVKMIVHKIVIRTLYRKRHGLAHVLVTDRTFHAERFQEFPHFGKFVIRASDFAAKYYGRSDAFDPR